VVPDKPCAIAGNAESIVSDAMEQNDGVAVRSGRPNFPCPKDCAIVSGHADIAQFGSGTCGCNHFLFFDIADWTPPRMRSHPSQANATEDGAD